MSALSKLFKEGVQHRQCSNDLVHPGPCLVFSFKLFFKILLTTGKYFVPLILAPLAMNIRKFDKKLLLKTLRYYFEAVVISSTVGWSSTSLSCVLRALLGKYYLYSLVWIPSTAVGPIVMLSSPRLKRLFYTSIFQSAIETILIQRKNFVSKTISDSVGLQNFLFMCCSAGILHAKQKGSLRDFWLLKPISKNDSSNNEQTLPQSPCIHQEQDCRQYLLKGMRNYFAFGLSLSLIAALIRQVPTHPSAGFMAKIFARLKNVKLYSTALLTSYVGIYRFAHCYFNRKSNDTLDLNHLAAGFLGGLSYIFYPNRKLLSYALLLNLQTLLKGFASKLKSTDPKYDTILVTVKRIPYVDLLFSYTLGYLAHTYVVGNKISYFAKVFVDASSSNMISNFNGSLQRTQQLLDAGVKDIRGTYC